MIVGAVENRAQRGQMIGGGAVALFGRARTTLQVVLTREHAVEARWRRRIHRVPPRIVDLDDHAAAVDHGDLVVQRGEHGGVQTLDALAARLGAPERGQVERVDHAAFVGGKPAMAEDHRHAPPVAQLQLELGVVEAFQQVAGVRVSACTGLAIPRGHVVEAQLAVLDVGAAESREPQEGFVGLADAQVVAPDRGRE